LPNAALAASGALACVQGQLNELGYDAGAVDGLWGSRTQQAAAEFAATSAGQRLQLPEIAVEIADYWCLSLRDQSVGTARLYADFVGALGEDEDPRFSLVDTRRAFLFDADYYLAQLPKDVVVSGNPIYHYANVGWKEGYDPSALFDTDAYLAANPDVREGGKNPLEHYITVGMDAYRGFGWEPNETGFIFHVVEGVPAERVAEIEEGLEIAQTYVSTALGSTIDPQMLARIVVKVEASGRGNQERAGGGAPATALSAQNDRVPRLFFDVGHGDWNQNSRPWGWPVAANNMKTVVHEFAHGWQALLGAMSIYHQPLGNWINEGLAEWVGYHAMDAAGLIDADRAHAFVASAARGPQLDNPLQVFGSTNTPAWAGHVGYLAIDWLVADAPEGVQSLRILGEEVADGSDARTAFLTAFGLEVGDFYQQFETYRAALRSNPARAIANRPALVRASSAYLARVLEGDSPASPAPASAAEAPTPQEIAQWYRNGVLAYLGQGVEKNASVAAEWFLKAAEHGHVAAMRNVAGMYGSGEGVAMDPQAATRWFRAAAEGGDAQGQYAYGNWYVQDRDEKVRWFRLASKQRHQDAIAALQALGEAVYTDALTLEAMRTAANLVTTAPYEVVIAFKGDAGGVTSICFFWTREGPICTEEIRLDAKAGELRTVLRTGRAATYELTAYAIVGELMSNAISTDIVVR